ncbi:MAG TPA: FecR family protein, partial [Polyangiales bacterium]
MNEPSPKLKAALEQVHAGWDPERTQRTLEGLPGRARVRRRRAWIAGGSATAVTLGALVWFAGGYAAHPGTGSVAVTPPPAPALLAPQAGVLREAQQLQLPDGSTVQLLDAATDVVVEHSAPERVALRIRAGHARLEIGAQDERVFQLRTSQVVFEVLGAVFEVAQSSESTWLRVESGRVRVVSGAKPSALEAGEEATFPAALDPEPASAPVSELERRPVRARAPAAPEAPNESWREHAERGEFKQAFSLLPGKGGGQQMDVSELLLAADAARLSGHPRAAVPFLERVVQQHASDARAPLAAFTLGGVLMNQLGMPREAEAAYAQARATSVGGALAQDALARQVEAAYRAGDE